MTPQQFWEDDPADMWAYWDAYQEKKRLEAEEADAMAFNQGQYFMFALAQCLQFTKNPKHIYPKKPFGINSNGKSQMSNKEREELHKIQMMQLAKRFSK